MTLNVKKRRSRSLRNERSMWDNRYWGAWKRKVLPNGPRKWQGTDNIPARNNRQAPPTDRKEAEELLNSIPDMPDIRTDDSKSRRKRFSEIVSCGGLREIMILSGSIFRKKCERRSRGRKMYAFEENQLRSALKAATGELSYSLSISSQQAEEMLEYKNLSS